MDQIHTDVLVIGGGLAGLVAALSARAAGRDVALLCRSRIGRSGNTLISGSALALFRRDNPYGDSAEIFINDTCRSGQGLNDRETVARFVEGSASVLDMLEALGVSFRYVDGARLIKQPPGHSVRRSYPSDYDALPYMIRGLSLGMPLREKAAEQGVRFFEPCDAVSLDVEDGRVCGAYVLDMGAQRILHCQASSVVLSCGGGASLFKNTNNTSDVTCDAYRLALEAGAVLRDMEFVQFYPAMMVRPVRGVVSTHLFGDGAVLRSRAGERFLQRYSPQGDRSTRDLMARAIQMEIRAGQGDPDCVYMDCSAVDRRTLDAKYPELSRQLQRYGLDIHADPIPVSPTAHFYLGGVAADENCAAFVPGLYACGEALGGLHGANRLSGNALTEAAVSGRTAGEAAAEAASRTVPNRTPRPMSVPYRTKGEDARALIRRLRTVMWDKGSILKTGASLSEASAEVTTIKTRSDGCAVRSVTDLHYLYELRSYLSTAELLIHCAQKRTESRGAFYREDYPETDTAWNGSLFCSLRDGEILSKFVPNVRSM